MKDKISFKINLKKYKIYVTLLVSVIIILRKLLKIIKCYNTKIFKSS